MYWIFVVKVINEQTIHDQILKWMRCGEGKLERRKNLGEREKKK